MHTTMGGASGRCGEAVRQHVAAAPTARPMNAPARLPAPRCDVLARLMCHKPFERFGRLRTPENVPTSSAPFVADSMDGADVLQVDRRTATGHGNNLVTLARQRVAHAPPVPVDRPRPRNVDRLTAYRARFASSRTGAARRYSGVSSFPTAYRVVTRVTPAHARPQTSAPDAKEKRPARGRTTLQIAR